MNLHAFTWFTCFFFLLFNEWVLELLGVKGGSFLRSDWLPNDVFLLFGFFFLIFLIAFLASSLVCACGFFASKIREVVVWGFGGWNGLGLGLAVMNCCVTKAEWVELFYHHG